jgi:hypothetical protein
MTPARGLCPAAGPAQLPRHVEACVISAGCQARRMEIAGWLAGRRSILHAPGYFDDAMVKEECLDAGVLLPVVFSALLNPAQNRVVMAVAPI